MPDLGKDFNCSDDACLGHRSAVAVQDWIYDADFFDASVYCLPKDCDQLSSPFDNVLYFLIAQIKYVAKIHISEIGLIIINHKSLLLILINTRQAMAL